MDDNKQLTQEEIKQRVYREAFRFMDNAEEALRKAGVVGECYKDKKYVQSASGIAYSGVLVGCGGLFELCGVQLILTPEEEAEQNVQQGKKPKKQKQRRPNIKDYYRAIDEVAEILGDPLLPQEFRSVYHILHRIGYYDGFCDIDVIRKGFNLAYRILERLRPDNPLPPLPLRPDNPFLSAMRQVAHFLWPFRVS